jgi:hypothetical protein
LRDRRPCDQIRREVGRGQKDGLVVQDEASASHAHRCIGCHVENLADALGCRGFGDVKLVHDEIAVLDVRRPDRAPGTPLITGQPLYAPPPQRLEVAHKHAGALPGLNQTTDVHFHDLRHTGNTLAASGASLRELMTRMGHSTPRAALIYQHMVNGRDREIADQLGSMIRKERGDASS